jgi:nucleotidyltransferase/DNA polymerase involved in DNA repair
MMFDVVRRYADEVEEYSIDECFADMTGLHRTLKMSIREIAERIQEEVLGELGLSVTIGLAPTKVLAKVASKHKKPHGLTEITTDGVNAILAMTPIEAIWGIGPRIAVQLHAWGIHSARDYREKDVSWVQRHFTKPQEAIWHELHGTPVYRVNAERKSAFGSLQRTRTFSPSTGDKNFLLTQIKCHIEDACVKARYYQLVPRKLMLYLRTQSFVSVAHVVSLREPTASPSILSLCAEKNFDKVYTKGTLYRSAGVTLCELVSTAHIQGNLFALSSDSESKFASVHARIDALEEKHGKRMVYLASTLRERKEKEGGGSEYDDATRNLLFL